MYGECVLLLKILCDLIDMETGKSIYFHIICVQHMRCNVKVSIYFCFGKNYRLRMHFIPNQRNQNTGQQK